MNLAVLAGLLLGLNLVSYGGIRIFRSADLDLRGDDRWRLSSYNGRTDRARLVLEESHSLECGERADVVVFLNGVNDVALQCLSPFRPPTHARTSAA